MGLSATITGVQHLGVPAADISKAVAFYCEKLGFQLIHRKVSVDSSGGAIEAAFVQLGDLIVELFKTVGNEKDILSRCDGVIDHYAIDAPDFDKCMQMGLRNGLAIHKSTPDGAVWYKTVGNKGVQGINFCGPNQEVIEFCHNYEIDYKNKTGLQGWSHLAIKVRDLEKSVAFYESLGFRKCADGYLDTPDGRLIIGFVELNGFQIEIIQVTSSLVSELEQKGPGHIDHIALDVTDVKEAFVSCKKEGYKLLTPVVKELSFFEHGIKYILIEGPDGEILEFNQKVTY